MKINYKCFYQVVTVMVPPYYILEIYFINNIFTISTFEFLILNQYKRIQRVNVRWYFLKTIYDNAIVVYHLMWTWICRVIENQIKFITCLSVQYLHEEHLSQIALIYYSYNKPWPLRVKEALQKDNKENDMKIQHPSSIGLFEINVKHYNVI